MPREKLRRLGAFEIVSAVIIATAGFILGQSICGQIGIAQSNIGRHAFGRLGRPAYSVLHPSPPRSAASQAIIAAASVSSQLEPAQIAPDHQRVSPLRHVFKPAAVAPHSGFCTPPISTLKQIEVDNIVAMGYDDVNTWSNDRKLALESLPCFLSIHRAPGVIKIQPVKVCGKLRVPRTA